MAVILLLAFTLVSSERVIEYRLSKNFGETFHDYSDNNRDGINGIKVGTDDQDTLPSDRGAYFMNSKSVIVIPDTDLNNKKIEFSAPYSIVIWTNLLNSEEQQSTGDMHSVFKRIGSGGNELSLNLDATMDLNLEVVQIEEVPPDDSSSDMSQSENSSESSYEDSSSLYSSFSSNSLTSDSSELSSFDSSEISSSWSSTHSNSDSDDSSSSNDSDDSSSSNDSDDSSSSNDSDDSPSSSDSDDSPSSSDSDDSPSSSDSDDSPSSSDSDDSPSSSDSDDSPSSSDSDDSPGRFRGRRLRFNKRLSDTGIQTGSWILLRLSVNQNSIEVFINEVSQGTQTINSYSEVNQKYLTYIGGSPNAAASIDGFIWSLDVDKSFLKESYIPTTTLDCEFAYYESGEFKCFPSELDISKNLNGEICPTSCSSCSSSSNCLDCKCSVSSCEIFETSNLCICPSDATATETTCSCGTGKYYSDRECKDCPMSHCLDCLDANTCLSCESNFIISDGLCVCPVGQYENQGKCENCVENCDTCSNSNECDECSAGFYSDSVGECQKCGENCQSCTSLKCIKCFSSYELKSGSVIDCECPLGFSDYDGCVLNRFEAESFVSSDNVVTVIFNETLNRDLSYSDFVIDASEIESPSIKFKVISSDKYQFSVKSDHGIDEGTVFNASLKDAKLYSRKSSLYYATDLAVKLNETPATNPPAEKLRDSVETVVSVALGITALAALIANPVFFWILINTLQILAYLPLNSSPIPEVLRKFFISMNYLNLFPSIADILRFSTENSSPYLEARRYEVDSAIFLVNIDIIVVHVLLNILLIFLLVLGKKCQNTKIEQKCSKWLKSYKYGYFLKLLTGIYLDFLVFSLVQLRSISNDVLGIISTCAALVVLAILVVGPFIVLICSFFATEKIKDSKNEEFHEKWGSLFDEFKNDKGYWSTQFYSVFMLRRLLYGLGQVYLNSQLYLLSSLNILGTFSVLVYGFRYFPYKEKKVNFCYLLGESGILVAMMLSLVFFTGASEKTKQIVEVVIMVFVFVCILLQILVCVISTILGLMDKLCGKRNALVIPHVMNEGNNTFAMDTSPTFILKSDNSTQGDKSEPRLKNFK